MPRLSLRIKLLASFILILLPVLGLLVYGYRDANERRIETVLDDQMQTAQSIAALVDANFDDALILGWALANDPIVHTLDPSQLDSHLAQFAPCCPQYEVIGIVNPAGDNVGISAPFPAGTQRKGLAADRPYFQQLMATGRPVVSPVLISRATLRPTIVLGVPIRDGKETIGAVLVTLYLEAFASRLESVTLRQEQHILLVDRTGTAAFQTGLPALPWEQRNLSGFEPIDAALEGKPTGVRRYVSPFLGDIRIGAFTPTSEYGWVVGVNIREDVALAPVRMVLRNQLLGFGAVAILTLGIVLILSHALLQPVRRLTDYALALGRGDLTQRVDIKTGDEMEELGQTFNQMAERLGRTLSDLRAVLDATESGILMYDCDLITRIVNRRMSEWFGVTEAEAIGQPFNVVARDLIAPKLADPAKLLARLDWLLEHPEEMMWEEVEMVRPEYRVLRLYIGPIRAGGECIGYIDVYTDITDIRRREEERKALGQVAEALVRERTMEGVAEVVVEQGQRVLRTSTVGLFLIDLEREELRLLAHRGLSPQTVDEIGILPLTATLLTALAARTGQPQEVPEVQDLGPELALARRVAEREGQRSLFAQPLFAKGHPVGVLSIAKPTPYRFTQWEREFMRAFADLIAVAMENARLNEELRETLHLRDEFLSVAAHELKTPITALRGYVQLLLRSKVPRPREERQGLEAIERQTKRITRLAEDLFETVSPSARPLQRQTFDLAALAEEEVQEAAQFSARHRLILCRPGPVFVEADAGLTRRVLMTLLDNAIRFSPEGGRIEVTATTENGMALVSVRDFGLGIPKERQRYVFEPFFEPYPAGTPGYTGVTGVGLYVAKTFVERLGGRVWFVSEEGQGSTFFFTLPLAQG